MALTVKGHKANRSELLIALEAVKPGLSPKPRVEHSNSFLFRQGRVEAFNDEVACRFRTKLPKELTCIVASKSLLAYLNKIGDETVTVSVNEETKEFTIRGSGKQSDFLSAFEETFEIDTVERPKKDSWKPLSARFGDGIGMVVECAKKDQTDSVLTCVHVHPDYVEASDDTQWCRFKVKTKCEQSFLVKEFAIRHLVGLDMTEFAETQSWVHFRNPAGLVFSCRRLAQKFPDVSHLVEAGNSKKMTLPRKLSDDVEGVNVAASEDKDTDAIVVELEPGKFRLRGIGVTVKVKHWKNCDYKGKPLSFMIQPKMLVEITKRGKDCLIGESRLRMNGDRWLYVTDLADPTAVRRAAEAKAALKEHQKQQEGDE